MPYADVEEKVHNLLVAALPDDVTVRRGYHQPDSLKSIRLSPGAVNNRRRGQGGQMTSEWVVDCEVKLSASSDDFEQHHLAILSSRQTIMDTIDVHPSLGGIEGSHVTNAMVSSIGESDYAVDGRVHTWTQVLYITATEHYTLKAGEYA